MLPNAVLSSFYCFTFYALYGDLGFRKEIKFIIITLEIHISVKGLCPQCCASVKAFLDAVKQRRVLLLTLSLFCPVRQMVFSVSTEGRLDFVQNQLMRTAAMNILHSVLCHESPIHCNVPLQQLLAFTFIIISLSVLVCCLAVHSSVDCMQPVSLSLW